MSPRRGDDCRWAAAHALSVNAGLYGNQKSDFAIAEVVVWPRGLTDEEMRRASDHLINRLGI